MSRIVELAKVIGVSEKALIAGRSLTIGFNRDGSITCTYGKPIQIYPPLDGGSVI